MDNNEKIFQVVTGMKEHVSFSRTCSRTCSCSRTRTEQQSKKYACSFIPRVVNQGGRSFDEFMIDRIQTE